MSLWKSVKSLKVKHIFTFLVLFAKHPLYAYATIKGTALTFKISERRFPKIHGGLNKANAFRHSLWNILIAKYAMKFSNDVTSVLDWTKRVTDLHEELAPNEYLAREMDLINNDLGRRWFNNVKNKSNSEIEEFLMDKLKNAIKINQASNLENLDNLVFLED